MTLFVVANILAIAGVGFQFAAGWRNQRQVNYQIVAIFLWFLATVSIGFSDVTVGFGYWAVLVLWTVVNLFNVWTYVKYQQYLDKHGETP